MDEMDDFIEYLESRIYKIRSDIRDFYRENPQYAPYNRDRSLEDVHNDRLLPEQRLALEIKKVIQNDNASSKRNVKPQRRKTTQKKK